MNVPCSDLPTKKRTGKRKVPGTGADDEDNLEASNSKSIQPLSSSKKTRKRKVSGADVGDDSVTSHVVLKSPTSSSYASSELDSEDLDKGTAESSLSHLHAKRKHNEAGPLSDHTIYSDQDFNDEIQSASLIQTNDANLSSSNWSVDDLKDLNVDYEKTPITVGKLFENVKQDYLKFFCKGSHSGCPDTTDVVQRSMEIMEKRIDFSLTMKEVTGRRDDILIPQHFAKLNVEKCWKKLDNILTEENGVSSLTSFQIMMGTYNFHQFLKRVLHLVDRTDVRRPCSEEDILELCETFLRMFYLNKGRFQIKTCGYRGKTIRSKPDLTYPISYKTRLQHPKKLFFVVKIKKKTPIPTNVEVHQKLESIIGHDVMGQVGAELLMEGNASVFFPHALAVLCMETKLLFLFLKRSSEHYNSMKSGCLEIKEEGRIAYTRPLDMLLKEDRNEMAEFLFWLGCIQDHDRYHMF